MKKKLPYIITVSFLILFVGFASFSTFLRQQPPTQPEDSTPVVTSPTTQTSALPVAMHSTNPSSFALTDILVTNQPSPDLSPLQHQVAFRPQDQIYITIKLPSEKVGSQVTAEMTYMVDQSKLGPVTSSVKTKDDLTYAMFELVPPPSGWPKGEYAVSIADPSSNALRQIPVTVK